ncbi:MAG: histidine kinase [Salinivirgaceae bacterium]|nr:histidine kinase [Salinivirgaceae bacterium]
MNKIIINNWAFRLLTPIVFAFFIYVLILLFFDSALQLLDNLISVEYFICLFLCFINFELWRVLIKICCKKLSEKPFKQIFIQSLLSVSSGLIITGFLVWFYFKIIVGLISFSSELIIFCSLFSISALLYNMVYSSQFLLNYQHKEIIIQEEKLKKEAVDRWQRFQNKINPNLLYQSLEKIIGYAHTNIEKADLLLMDLTNLYRQILDNQEEIISILKEIELLHKIKILIEKIYEKQVLIVLNPGKSDLNRHIIPGYLILQIQQIINENIANAAQPLKIEISVFNENVAIKFHENLKLSNQNSNELNLNYETETLFWYTNRTVEIKTNNTNLKEIIIPLINLENS